MICMLYNNCCFQSFEKTDALQQVFLFPFPSSDTHLFSAANKADVKEPCAFSFFFPLFIVFSWTFPMSFDTVSLCHSPEEIFKLLSGAIKVKYSTLLQHYFLRCVSLYKLSFVIFIF